MDITRIIRNFTYVLLLVALGILLISYRAVRQATYRKEMSAEAAAKNQKKRIQLLQDYGAQEVAIRTCDCIDLHGYLIVRKNAKKNILLCHGYRMTKEHMLPFLQLFPDDNFLLFDFRAHGQSGGELISIGCYEQRDVHAAIDFLAHDTRTKGLPLIGIGVSMGGATLLGAAAHGANFSSAYYRFFIC